MVISLWSVMKTTTLTSRPSDPMGFLVLGLVTSLTEHFRRCVASYYNIARTCDSVRHHLLLLSDCSMDARSFSSIACCHGRYLRRRSKPLPASATEESGKCQESALREGIDFASVLILARGARVFTSSTSHLPSNLLRDSLSSTLPAWAPPNPPEEA